MQEIVDYVRVRTVDFQPAGETLSIRLLGTLLNDVSEDVGGMIEDLHRLYEESNMEAIRQCTLYL